MKMDEAIKTIKGYCKKHDDCKSCPLTIYATGFCALIDSVPEEWCLPHDLFSNTSKYIKTEDVSEDIQHVGYSQEACGYEK